MMTGRSAMQRKWAKRTICALWHKSKALSRGLQEGEAIEKEVSKIRCPYCGHPVNVYRSKDAECKGVFLKCKNKDCKKEFELIIRKT